MAANNGFFNLLLPNIMEQSPQISASVVEISIVLAIFTLSTGIISPFMSTLGWRKPFKWITGGLIVTAGLYVALSQLHNIPQIDFVTLTIGVSTSFITPLVFVLADCKGSEEIARKDDGDIRCYRRCRFDN